MTGPWRVLILDRDPEDPRWLLAAVAMPSDVQPAELDAAGRYTDWQQVTQWVRDQLGRDAELVPVHDALTWTVAEQKPQRQGEARGMMAHISNHKITSEGAEH